MLNYKNKATNNKALIAVAENKRKNTIAKKQVKNAIKKITYNNNPLMAFIAKGNY